MERMVKKFGHDAMMQVALVRGRGRGRGRGRVGVRTGTTRSWR